MGRRRLRSHTDTRLGLRLRQRCAPVLVGVAVDEIKTAKLCRPRHTVVLGQHVKQNAILLTSEAHALLNDLHHACCVLPLCHQYPRDTPPSRPTQVFPASCSHLRTGVIRLRPSVTEPERLHAVSSAPATSGVTACVSRGLTGRVIAPSQPCFSSRSGALSCSPGIARNRGVEPDAAYRDAQRRAHADNSWQPGRVKLWEDWR
jgi:hypothetical protein